MDILELWAQSQSQSVKQLVSVSQSLVLSSFVFILYSISCIRIKNCYLLIAFLLCELYVNFIKIPQGYEYRFYFGCAFIYCLLYWLLVIDKAQLKTQLACGIMVLFEARMCIDAIFNSDVETYVYTNYEYITLLIHLYIISTLLPWAHIRRGLGNYTRALYSLSGISDGAAYIWYNCKQTKI